MTNMMSALVKSKPEPGLWREDRPVPEIGPDDVLIRVKKTGICGTDIHIWNWDSWAERTVPVGLITGHEFAGEIVDVGRNVTDLKIGQRCSGEGHLIGHHSRQSRSGKFHLDPETRGIGVNEPGAFAQYLRLPAFNVVPLPDEIDDEIGAILDPLGNAVHTALSFDLVGEDVLITGAGPIGIMAAAVARHVGARHVVITDVNQARLDLAAKVADCTPVNVAREDLRDVIARLKLAQGFDVGNGDVGQPAGAGPDGGKPGDGRPHRPAWHPARQVAGGLVAHRLQGHHHQGRLRPRDLRDLVQDDRHADQWPRYPPGHHPPLQGRRLPRGIPDHALGPVGQGRA